MKHYKNNIAVSILALFVAAIYFLVATSHIFLLNNRTRLDENLQLYNNIVTNKKAGAFYSKVDEVCLIKLIDKTTIENKKSFNDLIKLTADFFVVTLFFSALRLFEPRLFNIRAFRELINYQGHYLSTRTLRI